MTKQAEDHHPTAWYWQMKAQEKNAFWASIGGWTLDAMDVQIFTFAVPAIMVTFGVDKAAAGLIGTATLLTSAFGGWFAGALSDGYGRVPTLRITILWFSGFTFLCGLSQIVRERFVQEPAVSADAREKLAAAGEVPNFLEIFGPERLKTTVLACLLTTGAQGGYYAITTWLPTFLQTERKLTALGSGGYIVVTIIGSFVGYLASAWLNDRIGRRPNFILFAACSIVVVIAYTLIPVSDAMMLVLGFPLGFFASGIFSGMGPILTELFSHRMRSSGQGFAYNFGRGVAALNRWFVGLLSAVLPLAALLLPETKGSELPADVAPDAE